jgi:hypothetical protein
MTTLGTEGMRLTWLNRFKVVPESIRVKNDSGARMTVVNNDKCSPLEDLGTLSSST